MSADSYKRAAAARAVEFVRSGMRLGLGTGTTAAHFVELPAGRVRAGLSVLAVPTPEATRAHAARLGITLATLEDTPELDLTVDGADEIGPTLTIIKGGGGALLREKIVAAASVRMVVIADDSKCVPVLGHFPLPVEIVPFGATVTRQQVETAAADVGDPGPAPLRLDRSGHAFVTDSGHWLLDAQLRRITDSGAIARELSAIPGVMEHAFVHVSC